MLVLFNMDKQTNKQTNKQRLYYSLTNRNDNIQ